MGTQFLLDIREGHFSYQRNTESITREADTDGTYVTRSNAPASPHGAADFVRRCKDLDCVEDLFRTLLPLS